MATKHVETVEEEEAPNAKQISATKRAEKEARESEEKLRKEGKGKSQDQIDAERAESGEEVPEEERGKPTNARRWIAAERERQERADTDRFRAEYSAKRASRDVEREKAGRKDLPTTEQKASDAEPKAVHK